MLQSKYVTSQSLPSQSGVGAGAGVGASAGAAAAFGVSVFKTDTSDDAADGMAVFGSSVEDLGLNRLQCKQKNRWK